MSHLAPKDSNIFGFDLAVRLDENGGWESLSKRVGDLLEAVCDHHQKAKVRVYATRVLRNFVALSKVSGPP